MLDRNFAISLMIALLTRVSLGVKITLRRASPGRACPKTTGTLGLVVMPLAILPTFSLPYGIPRGPMFAGFAHTSAIAFCNITGFSGTRISLSTGALTALMAFAMQKTPGDRFCDVALSVKYHKPLTFLCTMLWKPLYDPIPRPQQ